MSSQWRSAVRTTSAIFTNVVALHSGDQILLCSDGLHGVVSENIAEGDSRF